MKANRKRLLILLAVLVCVVIVHGLVMRSMTTRPNPVAEEAAAAWWKEFNKCIYCPPEPVGTWTPAHTIYNSKGQAYNIGEHVQTMQEWAKQEEDARYVLHKQQIVQGFRVTGYTITVVTNLAKDRAGIADAADLCSNLGSFIWSAGSGFGLQNIRVIGQGEEMLAMRNGLKGEVRVALLH